jgi:hypothetical protein
MNNWYKLNILLPREEIENDSHGQNVYANIFLLNILYQSVFMGAG